MLSVLTALLLFGAQRQAKTALEERFGERTTLAARFTQAYTRDLLRQERRVAAREMAGRRVTSDDFERTNNLFGYQAAVLLDSRGRALRVLPYKRELVGADLARQYAHLQQAAAGHTAISKVVPSAANGVPIVAFATPFASRSGRRVFSGAFQVEETPIGAYLHRVTPLRGAHVYLSDSAGSIIASNRSELTVKKTIRGGDPTLAKALAHSPAGETSAGYQYASRPVAGTPWRIVLSVPQAELFRTVQGPSRYLSWILWGAFVLMALASVLLVDNLLASRRKLRKANEDLDRLARIDSLTGLYNRRQTQDSLEAALATAHRHRQPLSVLMIDVDHFKQVNDLFGHQVGDEVLCGVAQTVRSALRGGDTVGRWGGEEFLALLPSTDAVGAQEVAQRLSNAVASTPSIIGDEFIPVSISVGVATLGTGEGERLVAEADEAMYTAKQAGRNRVHAAPQ